MAIRRTPFMVLLSVLAGMPSIPRIRPAGGTRTPVQNWHDAAQVSHNASSPRMEGLPTTEARSAAHESQLLALSPDLLGAVGYDGLLKLHNPAWARSLGMSES